MTDETPEDRDQTYAVLAARKIRRVYDEYDDDASIESVMRDVLEAKAHALDREAEEVEAEQQRLSRRFFDGDDS